MALRTLGWSMRIDTDALGAAGHGLEDAICGPDRRVSSPCASRRWQRRAGARWWRRRAAAPGRRPTGCGRRSSTPCGAWARSRGPTCSTCSPAAGRWASRRCPGARPRPRSSTPTGPRARRCGATSRPAASPTGPRSSPPPPSAFLAELGGRAVRPGVLRPALRLRRLGARCWRRCRPTSSCIESDGPVAVPAGRRARARGPLRRYVGGFRHGRRVTGDRRMPGSSPRGGRVPWDP